MEELYDYKLYIMDNLIFYNLLLTQVNFLCLFRYTKTNKVVIKRKIIRVDLRNFRDLSLFFNKL